MFLRNDLRRGRADYFANLDQAIDYAAISAKKNAPRWIKQLQAIGKWRASSTPAAQAAH